MLLISFRFQKLSNRFEIIRLSDLSRNQVLVFSYATSLTWATVLQGNN